jgi:hypothetical protein
MRVNPSSILCRAQEAHHRDRAAGTQLANVRMVAERAASAWGVEALIAEKRERRHIQTVLTAACIRDKKQFSPAPHDQILSGNLDRDLARV